MLRPGAEPEGSRANSGLDGDSGLPPGWIWWREDDQREASLGPWRSFRFGFDLRLAPIDDVWVPPKQVDTTVLHEEGLETLLLLNLDVLWPHFHLVLSRKTLSDWAGADIQASDPSGARHVFEVKFGAPANHVVDQVLAYTLGVVRQTAMPEPAFRDLGSDQRERFIACRVAAFWTRTRADKWPRDKAKAPANRDWSALREILVKASPVTVQALRLTVPALRLTASQLDRLVSHAGHAPRSVSECHFHLCVPDPVKINFEQFQALGRLRWRGARASVWQVAVDLSAEPGRLSIREWWIPPNDPARAGWHRDVAAHPSCVSMAELVATAANIDPVTVDGARPRLDRRDRLDVGDPWDGAGPAVQVERFREDGHEWFRMIGHLNVPKSLGASWPERAGTIQRERYLAVRDWIVEIARPSDPRTLSSVTELRRITKSWVTEDKSGRTLRATHTGGLATARVEWVTGDVEADARLLLRGLVAARDAGLRYPDSFGRIVSGE